MARLLQLATFSFLIITSCSAAATGTCKGKGSGKNLHANGKLGHSSHGGHKWTSQTVSTVTEATTSTVSTSVDTAAPTSSTQQQSKMVTSKASAPTTSTVAPPKEVVTSSTQAAQTPASTPVSNTASADIQAYLDSHNNERAKHGAVALVWNNTLADAAQNWANQCTGTHSGGSLGPYGENLSTGTGNFTIPTAIQLWLNEAPEYDPSNPQFSHWTQVVWKGTTNLGCAVAECDNLFDFSKFGRTLFYVCEYWPAGNVIGQFAQNVQA